MEKEYKVGDKVWIRTQNFVIHCTITEVDDYFRRQHPQAKLSYWVDEPIGHGLHIEDLFDTKEAIDVPLITPKDSTLLSKMRERKITFIEDTWQDTPGAKMDRGFIPEKNCGIDWFLVPDLDLDLEDF